MNTVKFNKQSVKMVAHRGVSGLERENTCAAFVAAGNRSYFGIETDVQEYQYSPQCGNPFSQYHDTHLPYMAVYEREKADMPCCNLFCLW